MNCLVAGLKFSGVDFGFLTSEQFFEVSDAIVKKFAKGNVKVTRCSN